jgi:hypothetical protein
VAIRRGDDNIADRSDRFAIRVSPDIIRELGNYRSFLDI